MGIFSVFSISLLSVLSNEDGFGGIICAIYLLMFVVSAISSRKKYYIFFVHSGR